MSHEHVQGQTKFERFKKAAKRAALPAAISAGILFPAGVYADTAINQKVTEINNNISNLSDNSTAQTLEAVAIATGLAMTGSAYVTGRRWDEKRLYTLRVAGPVLLTAGITSVLLDSKETINYAIPAGLTYASSLAFGTTNIVSTFERTRHKDVRGFAVASSGMIMTAGTMIFLAAAGKL